MKRNVRLREFRQTRFVSGSITVWRAPPYWVGAGAVVPGPAGGSCAFITGLKKFQVFFVREILWELQHALTIR
ncbi:hypothetical protein [Leptospira broomii]|uniref:hypothetical protein n=1 Tax=Leptospira broomii TaxID=301541 RepID=UPI000289751F|nr:hypothetical protein [Leptospira broomii]